MSTALYQKYRPKKFSEVVGQEHVVQTLQGALKTGRLAHAYLFTGPRGTGKTTLARLLAKAVNCEKNELRSEGDEMLSTAVRSDACGVCSFCKEIEEGRAMDLIEIDAASNRGIDEIRALREGARFSSARGKFKVYVIDECHMLTKEASNALLKTLEEPPAKTLFILATTEPGKILLTIISRVQRFDLKKHSSEQTTDKLETIAKTEKVKIDRNLLKLIALASEGSLRDAESSLAKLIAFKGQNIDEATVKEVLGIIPLSVFGQFFELVTAKKRGEAIALVSHLYESGLDLDIFIKGLLDFTRKVLVTKASPAMAASYGKDIGEEHARQIAFLALNMEGRNIVRLINILLRAREEMKISPIPQLPLELAITELTE